MSQYRIDRSGSAPGIAFSAYLVVLSLLAAYFYSLMQPHYNSNPGLAAYKPPPATVIDYGAAVHYEMPAPAPAQPQQAPPLAEIESRPEEPKPAVAEPQRERKVAVKKQKRPSTRTASRARNNPYRHYATPYYYSRGRGAYGRYATPYYGYWGYRAF